MKGTLISFDFVKDSNDDIKFLEMNTDTTISATALENCISWEFFLNHLSASSISQIDVIYKKPYHGKLVNHLSASVVESAPFITTFNRHEELANSIFPVSLDDSSDKFILRMAYDDNAIVDNTYCAVGSEPLRLLNEINSSSLAVPFFYTGSEGEFDTLIEQSNPANIPDVVLKTKRDGLNGVKFAKVQDWSTFRSTYGDDYYITNYGISSSSLNTEQTVSSFRHYTIAYGGGLEMLDLGGYKQYAEFGTLPTNLAVVYIEAIKDITPTENDKLIEIALNGNGKPVLPLVRKHQFDISVVDDYRLEDGAIMYYRLTCLKQYVGYIGQPIKSHEPHPRRIP